MDNKKLKIEKWLPLESNCDVLNNYLSMLGVNSEIVQFVDIVSFDKENLLYMQAPIVGALFVFPDSKKINNHFFELGDKMFEREPPVSLYYMKQIVENACGTVAILHILLNIFQQYDFIFQEDSFVTKFYNDTKHMDPEQRAEYLNNCKITFPISKAHDDVAQDGVPEKIEMKAGHHFICFIWKDGQVCELDGGKKNAINYGECKQEEFMAKVFDICLEHYVNQDLAQIGFNLMALQLGF